MTDERILRHLRQLGITYDDIGFNNDRLYKILIEYTKIVEEETMINSKAKWYQEGVEAEREACAKLVEYMNAEDDLDIGFVADEIRARGE
jgi:hypothetical protein